MTRRTFLFSGFAVLFLATKRFAFRIKTKDKSIIGLTIQATDIEAAKVKVFDRYPGAEILSAKEL